VLARIFELLRRESGIDFAGYKASTVGRRIQRRLLLTRSGDMDEYLDRIAKDPAELRLLYCDLLIGVTRFFRDEEAFERLRTEVLPALVDGVASDEELRMWVVGCATGEEAYSMAIEISEAFRGRNRVPAFRVFATTSTARRWRRRASACIRPTAWSACRPRCARCIFARTATACRCRPICAVHVVFRAPQHAQGRAVPPA
jgi:two-component system CheB/CheR fusion protein